MSSGQQIIEQHTETHHDVTITVDTVHHKVRKGDWVVSNLKAKVGVDAALVLDEVVHGHFRTLDDSDRIEIKGGEVFISHARKGGSS